MHRPTLASDDGVGWDFAPVRRRGNGSSARLLIDDGGGGLIRPTVNIVSIVRWPVRQWRIAAAADRPLPPFFPLSRVAARTVAAPQPHRRHNSAAARRAGLRGGVGIGSRSQTAA